MFLSSPEKDASFFNEWRLLQMSTTGLNAGIDYGLPDPIVTIAMLSLYIRLGETEK